MLMVATEIQRVVSGRTFAGLYPLQSRSFELGNLLFTEQLLVLCGRLLFGLLRLLRRWLGQLGLWLCCCFCRRLLTILARGFNLYQGFCRSEERRVGEGGGLGGAGCAW